MTNSQSSRDDLLSHERGRDGPYPRTPARRPLRAGSLRLFKG
jgi:hypothetical protein